MVTTAKGNWTFPKGLVERGLSLGEACAKEVLEEGGVESLGQGSPRPTGATFTYVKDDWGGPEGVVCEVHLFTVDVDIQYEVGDARWPDDGEGSQEYRQRRWLDTDEVIRAVKSRIKGKPNGKNKGALRVAKATANQAVLDLLLSMTT